jgi:hypothetical protein
MTVRVSVARALVPLDHKVSIDRMSTQHAKPRRQALVRELLPIITAGGPGAPRGCVSAATEVHVDYAVHRGCHVRLLGKPLTTT